MNISSRHRILHAVLLIALIAAMPLAASDIASAEDGTPRDLVGDNNLTAVNSMDYPFRSIVRITRNGSGHCSGFLISADTVATAGHCIWPQTGSKKYEVATFTVYPGYDSRLSDPSPYGSCSVRQSWAHPSYVNTFDSEGKRSAHQFDYGILKLNCKVGDRTGVLKLRINSGTNQSFEDQAVSVSGYPADSDGRIVYDGRVQYRGSGKVKTGSHIYNLWYTSDTMRGHSGSPVYQWSSTAPCGNRFCVLAIHSNTGGTTYNEGVRITPRVYDDLMGWANS